MNTPLIYKSESQIPSNLVPSQIAHTQNTPGPGNKQLKVTAPYNSEITVILTTPIPNFTYLPYLAHFFLLGFGSCCLLSLLTNTGISPGLPSMEWHPSLSPLLSVNINFFFHDNHFCIWCFTTSNYNKFQVHFTTCRKKWVNFLKQNLNDVRPIFRNVFVAPQ